MSLISRSLAAASHNLNCFFAYLQSSAFASDASIPNFPMSGDKSQRFWMASCPKQPQDNTVGNPRVSEIEHDLALYKAGENPHCDGGEIEPQARRYTFCRGLNPCLISNGGCAAAAAHGRCRSIAATELGNNRYFIRLVFGAFSMIFLFSNMQKPIYAVFRLTGVLHFTAAAVHAAPIDRHVWPGFGLRQSTLWRGGSRRAH